MNTRLAYTFALTLWVVLVQLSASTWVRKDWRMAVLYTALTVIAIMLTVKSAYRMVGLAPYPYQQPSGQDHDEPISIVLLCAGLSFIVGFWGSIIFFFWPEMRWLLPETLMLLLTGVYAIVLAIWYDIE